MLPTREGLCQDVGNLVTCGDVLDRERTLLERVADGVVAHSNVLRAVVKWRVLRKSHRELVVNKNARGRQRRRKRMKKGAVEVVQECAEPEHFLRSSRKSDILGLSARLRNWLLLA